MTRPEFLAAASELGLNPRQAMDRLKVRSLEGLNLREALESLRRQMLAATTAIEPAPATAPASTAAPASEARYFEEEDDETIFYSEDDEDEALDEEPALPADGLAARAATKDTDNADEDGEDALEEMDDQIDLEDVPDLAPPTPSPRRRAAPAREAAATSTTPAANPAFTSGARTQAMQLIGRLRTATGGGPASDYQRNAYRNIVEEELGKTQATALVRGLWRTTADRLSAGQLEALIRWGKEEVFAEEALLVLAALRAEQRRAEQADEPAPRAATRGRSTVAREGER